MSKFLPVHFSLYVLAANTFVTRKKPAWQIEPGGRFVKTHLECVQDETSVDFDEALARKPVAEPPDLLGAQIALLDARSLPALL